MESRRAPEVREDVLVAVAAGGGATWPCIGGSVCHLPSSSPLSLLSLPAIHTRARPAGVPVGFAGPPSTGAGHRQAAGKPRGRARVRARVGSWARGRGRVGFLFILFYFYI